MIDFSRFNNLISVITYFADETRCKETIARTRWTDGDVVCPYCGQHHCTTRKDGRYRCNNCKNNFTVTVGTIFENSKLPLPTWFAAMYLISSHKKGFSSHQLARDINVTQKSAWYMLMRIRSLFTQDNEQLEGDIELDEAYIGYNSLNDSEYSHSVVFHNAGEFVIGEAHTNGMEGFWGHLSFLLTEASSGLRE